LETYDRVSVTVGFVLLGLVLFLLVDLPSRTFAFAPLGSLLTVQLSKQWLRALLTASLAVAGAHSTVSAHPLARSGAQHPGLTAWIAPGLIGLLVPFLLPLAPDLRYWLGGLALAAVVLGGVILLEYYTTDPDAPEYDLARLTLSVLTYTVALAAFVLIYQSRSRSLVTATATSLVSALMAWRMLQGLDASLRRIVLYAALVGLVMGQCTWALNYWRIHALTGGVLLLLFFYVSLGMAQQHLQALLTRRVAIEYGAVAAIGLWLVLRFGVWLGI